MFCKKGKREKGEIVLKKTFDRNLEGKAESIKKYQNALYLHVKDMNKGEMVKTLERNLVFAQQGGNLDCVAVITEMLEVVNRSLPF